MSDLGTVYPPRDEFDIAAYDLAEVVEGYIDHRPDDPPPGENRSPAYRWGWTNHRRDTTGNNDGFERIREAFIRMSRRPQ